MKIDNAVMLCVGHKDWTLPKSVLVSANEVSSGLIKDMVNEAYNNYKKEYNSEVFLIDYVYYGTVEVIS